MAFCPLSQFSFISPALPMLRDQHTGQRTHTLSNYKLTENKPFYNVIPQIVSGMLQCYKKGPPPVTGTGLFISECNRLLFLGAFQCFAKNVA
jgi:hypothetical protein